MSTRETVYSLRAASLRMELVAMRAKLQSNRSDRLLELRIEDTEEEIELLVRDHTSLLARQKKHEAERATQQARARGEREAELARQYRSAVPVATDAELQAFLQNLIRQHTLDERDREQRYLAHARSRVRT